MQKRFSISFFLLSLLLLSNSARAQMRVHFINVGQGNATLVEFPCSAVLIDAGGESNGEFNSNDALKDYLDDFFALRPDLDSTFEALYITHPHIDHTRGIRQIVETYKIKNVITNGMENGSGGPQQKFLHRTIMNAEATLNTNDDIGFEAVLLSEISNQGFSNTVIDPIHCGTINPAVTILWGNVNISNGWSKTTMENTNNHSLVIKISYGTSSILFTGDLEEEGIKNLVKKYVNTGLLDADVFEVGHHGSKNGTTKELLQAITPSKAVISMGNYSRETKWTAWDYGHPNQNVIKMLEENISDTRTSKDVHIAKGNKSFKDHTITKAIFATGWDDSFILEADANGNWKYKKLNDVDQLVNINTATIEELNKLPKLGITKSQAIIDYRTAHGRFNTIDDLDNVPGFGPATINFLRPLIKILP